MTHNPDWTLKLDDGLVMRGAVPEDAEALSDYNAEMHLEPDEFPGPAFWISEWTRDLLTKPHPSLKPEDIIIVEDTKSGKIVSSCAYFQQTWSYCGIPVPFGRPEIVSTHHDYRNRGLIRKQFELMHRWGDERGHLVQGITGIPYYYRQFGYEMALEMGRPRRASLSQLPAWKEGEERTARLRRAEPADVPLMLKFQHSAKKRSLFAPDVTEAELEYQLFRRDERSAVAMSPWVIEDAAGTAIGFAAMKAIPSLQVAEIKALEFADDVMFRTHTVSLLKSMHELLDGLPKEDEKAIERIALELFSGHPAHPFIGRNITSSGNAYAWYVRAPDLPKLLKLIAPKLEERLIGTSFEGLTGEKLISFYRSGLRLRFKSGRLESVSSERLPDREQAAVNMPDLTFLQVLFGRKSFSEVAEFFVDAYANSDENELLMETLFPKMSSDTRFALS